MAHLEGVRVNLSDVVQHHQHSSQRIHTGEQAHIAEQQELLKVVVKRALMIKDISERFNSKCQRGTENGHVKLNYDSNKVFFLCFCT